MRHGALPTQRVLMGTARRVQNKMRRTCVVGRPPTTVFYLAGMSLTSDGMRLSFLA